MSADSDKARVGRRLVGALIDELVVSGLLSLFSIGALGAAYYIAQDCFGGQSIGRRVAKQELIDVETGLTVDASKAALRNLVALLCASTVVLLLVDLGMVLMREDGRRICDLLVGTQVVDVVDLAEAHDIESPAELKAPKVSAEASAPVTF